MSTLLEPASTPSRDNYIVAAFMAGPAGLAPPAGRFEVQYGLLKHLLHQRFRDFVR